MRNWPISFTVIKIRCGYFKTRKMVERLKLLPHECTWQSLLYDHGTHFVFPESLLKAILPIGSSLLVKAMFKDGKEYPGECKKQDWISTGE